MNAGADFTAISRCPRCGHMAFHPLREANPDPPKEISRGTGEVVEIRNAAGHLLITEVDGDKFDRWDERGYNVVRQCDECNGEWGQR